MAVFGCVLCSTSAVKVFQACTFLYTRNFSRVSLFPPSYVCLDVLHLQGFIQDFRWGGGVDVTRQCYDQTPLSPRGSEACPPENFAIYDLSDGILDLL